MAWNVSLPLKLKAGTDARSMSGIVFYTGVDVPACTTEFYQEALVNLKP